jgi:hypothetical protein
VGDQLDDLALPFLAGAGQPATFDIEGGAQLVHLGARGPTVLAAVKSLLFANRPPQEFR